MQKHFVRPYLKQIAYQDPLKCFESFYQQEDAVFLDSAGRGRYSYIASQPSLRLRLQDGKIHINEKSYEGDIFLLLQSLLQERQVENLEGLPPFQCGAIGFLAYDFLRYIEDLPQRPPSLHSCPDLSLGFYETVLAFDHEKKKAWIFAVDFSEENNKQLSKAKIEVMLKKLSCVQTKPLQEKVSLQSDLDQAGYLRQVKQVKEAIFEGEFFELNLSQRFFASLPKNFCPFALYKKHRRISPAPFSAYLSMQGYTIASSSPERFLKLENNKLKASPMKGTRRRSKDPYLDKLLAQELLSSAKDRAENVMIVDLMRNDLSKVCTDLDAIELCTLQSYQSVHQLVSIIEGSLNAECSAVDCIKAAFPSGSISGAPKPRVMEFIDQIERSSRGSYCGSVLALGFNGFMDSSVLIRSYAISDDLLSFGVGGAIVLDSDPLLEYEEMMLKAQTLLKALEI